MTVPVQQPAIPTTVQDNKKPELTADALVKAQPSEQKQMLGEKI